MYLAVTVHPKAGKDVLVQTGPGRFEAWVKAKPFEGQANEAVAALVGRVLQIPAGRLRLIKGARTRHKVFRVVE